MPFTLRRLTNGQRWTRVQPWLLLAPALLVVLVLFLGAVAFAIAQSVGYFPLVGLAEPTLDTYRDLLGSREFLTSLGLTFYIATASTLLAITLGVGAALVLRRTGPGRRVFAFLFQLNLPVPHLVGAVMMLFLLGQSGFLARIAHAVGAIDEPAQFPALLFDPWALGVIAEFAWKEVPFIGLIALAILATVGEDYEEVAASLGASRWQRLRHVTLPLVLPGVLAASVIVFAFTFGTFEVPLLLGGSFPQTLPVLAFRRYTGFDLSERPEAMAISVVMVVVVLVCTVSYMWLARRYLRSG